MSRHPSEDMADMPVPTLVGMTCLQAAVFTVIGVGLWWLSGRPLSEFVTVDAQQIFYGVALAGALIVGGYLLFKLLPKLGEQLIRDQAHSLAFLRNKLGWGPIIILSLCAGIWEEALFRGGLLVIASDYIPFWAALVVTSALFSLMHLAKLRVATFIFIIGIVFGLLYFALESLLAVMIGHALYDIWAIWYVQNEMHRLGVFDEVPEEPTKVIDGTGSSA